MNPKKELLWSRWVKAINLSKPPGSSKLRFAFMSLWPQSMYVHRGNHEDSTGGGVQTADIFRLSVLASETQI